ncbi:hypothetical protein TNIN_478721 [Trichonephila inaurata madagascariensis]|uniref:Uncharacterized protein n=1 Tax=Trichonephila inaurata madagascariensis TaxID=2747483 RepID=A0A8X6I2Q6_9ARAC|nr:hypothetical protein TNIN_478721 [Trichonephila inaurata madagascariensis]
MKYAFFSDVHMAVLEKQTMEKIKHSSSNLSQVQHPALSKAVENLGLSYLLSSLYIVDLSMVTAPDVLILAKHTPCVDKIYFYYYQIHISYTTRLIFEGNQCPFTQAIHF